MERWLSRYNGLKDVLQCGEELVKKLKGEICESQTIFKALSSLANRERDHATKEKLVGRSS